MLPTMSKRLYQEGELGAVAKGFRERAKKTKDQAAKELGVRRTSVQLAEENPEQSLLKLRKRLIEEYSDCKVSGPFYVIEKK